MRVSRRTAVVALLAFGAAGCVPTPEDMIRGRRPEPPGPELTGVARLRALYRNDDAALLRVAAHADHAALAWLAYEDARRDGARLPRGWRQGEVHEERYGTSGDLAAAVFRGPRGQVVLAFRGTDQWQDWVTDNASSVFQFGTPMIRRARALAVETKAAHPGVVFVGHSLGGRLAIVASIATGNEAVVFDSAFPSFNDTVVSRLFRNGAEPRYTAFSSPWDPVAGFTAFEGTVVRNYPRYAPRTNPANPGFDDLLDPVLFFHDPGLLARAMAEVRDTLAGGGLPV